VPENENTLRLRLGFSYSFGTAWWDDVTVTTMSPLVSRIALSGPRVSPAMDGIPVEILNRDGTKGPVTVRVTLGKEKGETKVELTATRRRRSSAREDHRARPMELTAALFKGSNELGSEKAQGDGAEGAARAAPADPDALGRRGRQPAPRRRSRPGRCEEPARGGVLTARILDKSGAEKASWSSEGKAPSDGVNGFSLSAGALPAGGLHARRRAQTAPR
jgi:hypothetical protein